MNIRPYRDSDFHPLLHLWEQAIHLDTPTPGDFVRRVLLDENRSPDGLLIAETEEDKIAGFVLCLTLRHPIENVGLLEERGFISAFGVLPEMRRRGIGRALFEQAERWFAEKKRREIVIAPYPPNYFIPGVDKNHYAPAVSFLQNLGYEEFTDAIAMDAAIGQFELPKKIREKEKTLAAEGIKIEPLSVQKLVQFLIFMEKTMPGDWVQAARDRLREIADHALFDAVWLAIHGGEIVGYCQFDGEHFGPFGVADTHQGRGIGTVLLAKTLLQMRKSGHHSAYVLWTGERAAQGVYAALGFQITRRFGLFRKQI